jgi:hypothetical protein
MRPQAALSGPRGIRKVESMSIHHRPLVPSWINPLDKERIRIEIWIQMTKMIYSSIWKNYIQLIWGLCGSREIFL